MFKISKNISLKRDFILIILFSSIVPFIVSVFLLFSTIQNANIKTELATKQLQKNLELELIETFHYVQNSAYTLALSQEIGDFLSSTIDTEKKYKIETENLISNIQNKLLYKNSKWFVLSSIGRILIEIPSNINHKEEKTKFILSFGTYLNTEDKSIQFTVPISYSLNKQLNNIQNKLGYIVVILDFNSIKNIFPKLQKINELPSDLNPTNFNATFKSEKINTNSLFILYIYIIVSFIFTFLAIIIGLNIFQKKIINKLLSLTSRVQNEMIPIKQNTIKNEIISLSETFTKYFKYISFLQIEIQKASQLAAVGNLSHLIAHDIKKPFSQVKFFIEELEHCTSLEYIKNTIQDHSKSIHDSSEYIENILKEIMDANLSKLNITENVKIETLLKKAFSHIRVHTINSNIEFCYKLNHSHFINVDEQRMIRVVVNIISNALDAMKYTGKIWIYTNENEHIKNNFVEITIGNNNSYIPPNNIESIFEPFFTTKKEGGTGLGLSIAQKIIHMHGGSLKCNSDIAKGVEFVFQLPISNTTYSPSTEELPIHLFSEKNSLKTQITDNSQQEIKGEENYILSKSLNSIQKTIIVIDDDPLICRNWKRVLKEINTLTFLDPLEFLEILKNNSELIKNISIIISDFYFGQKATLTFYEFISELRKIYYGKICLSSDKYFSDNDFLNSNSIVQIEKRPYSLTELENFLDKQKE